MGAVPGPIVALSQSKAKIARLPLQFRNGYLLGQPCTTCDFLEIFIRQRMGKIKVMLRHGTAATHIEDPRPLALGFAVPVEDNSVKEFTVASCEAFNAVNAGDESFLCKGQVLKYVGHGDTKTETRGLGKLGLLRYEVDFRGSGWFCEMRVRGMLMQIGT